MTQWIKEEESAKSNDRETKNSHLTITYRTLPFRLRSGTWQSAEDAQDYATSEPTQCGHSNAGKAHTGTIIMEMKLEGMGMCREEKLDTESSHHETFPVLCQCYTYQAILLRIQ